MLQKVHAISGLPRSGSTLLSALLRQNPRFTANMTSPVCMLTYNLLEQMSPGKEFSAFFDDDRRRDILRSVFNAYYAGSASEDVVFDTNRVWSGRTALLKTLYPEARVICCVRDIGWIIDSIERMLRKNPLQTSRLFNFKPGSSIYARVQTLMNTEAGLIGVAWSSLHEAWHSDDASRLILVQYDSLVQDPAATLKRLYRELGEEPFEHDFDNVEYAEPDYDAHLGMPGMHKVRSRVSSDRREPSIPPELFKRHENLSFWSRPEERRRGVTVI